ncbi:Rhodanese-related sulfurtransferase [Cupriavidus basilensis]|uniref:Rhodanese-related sulfurtransferase n=1 Tax=Cupriavidus basilensis TaxID=68895 RepID=A0A0C4YP55_9BURK|nr:Rhodanese-related sulfurtransferase [Cupriavidus basilensis]
MQATDQYIGVRGSRVIVFDDDGVRAPVVASWLYQLGYESAVLAHGVNAAIKAPAPPRTLPAHALPVLDANLLRALHAEAPDVLRIDLRDSAEYARGHAEGAAWSIRPRLPVTLERLGATHAPGGQQGCPKRPSHSGCRRKRVSTTCFSCTTGTRATRMPRVPTWPGKPG